MNFIIVYFLLSLFSFGIQIDKKESVYTLSDFFNEINKNKISEEDSKNLISYLCQILERYIYLDRLKKPPYDYYDYHKIDLIEQLKKVNTKERPLYEFYRDVKKIIDYCQDGHLNIMLNRLFDGRYSLADCFFIIPVSFIIDNKKVYAVPIFKDKDYFSKDIIDKIEKNQKKPIYTINNLNPIDFIQNFNGDFEQQKSPQGQFVINQLSIYNANLQSYPFNIEELNKIEIIYSDGDLIGFYYKVLIYQSLNAKNFNYLEYLNQNAVLLRGSSHKKLFAIKWDESIENGKMKCRIDHDNGVNVIYQNSFQTQLEITKSFYEKCFKSFDDNTYPLVIIEHLNGGGSFSDYMINYINLNNIHSIPSSFRYNDDLKKNVASTYTFREIETCKDKNGEYFFKSDPINEIIVNDDIVTYIVHKHTKIFDASTIDHNMFYKIRENTKNIRKPHQIIIFTDGYSYSATSTFIKDTQLRGGAIIVGYGGNPNLEKFDGSQSPASVVSTKDFIKDNLSKKIENLGFTVRYTITEHYKYNEIKDKVYESKTVPLEYTIRNIDERIDIYNDYDDSKYQQFIDNAKNIFNKYENNCNPYNKNLLKIDNACIFEDEHMHGGYECKIDGTWSNNCVPSYCDNGYIFDKEFINCKKDICIKRISTFNKVVLISTII